MRIRYVSYATIILILTGCLFAEAQKRKFKGFSFKGNPTAYKSNNKTFSAGFAIIGAQGSMGNANTEAPDRDMYFTPVQVFLGFRMGPIRLAAQAEYQMVSQITDALEVADTNTSGTGISFGPRLDYYNGIHSFGIYYRAAETFKLSKPDITNQQQEYKATQGYTIQYTRRLSGRLGFVLDYSQEEFSESITNNPVSWNRAGIGLIFSNFDLNKR